MNKLFIILIVLVIILYVRFNLKYNDYYEILQVKPGNLTPDVFNERKPIVIQNGNYTQQQIISSALRYMYINQYTITYEPNEKPIENKAKFLFISVDKPCEIEIINPKYKSIDDYESISVKLNTKNILVIPAFWKYKCQQKMTCTFVHDIFSLTYHTITNII